MTREKLIELLNANDALLNRIGAIINYDDDVSDQSIEDAMDKAWGYDDANGFIYYARNDGGDIYEYAAFQVSSLGAKGEEFFMGESDGITYAMGHQEDDNWDNTYLLILDNNNKVSVDDE